jgi:hypothetical protein
MRASAGRVWWHRAIDWIVPEENPAGIVYGVITIGALLAAESGLHESYLDTFASAAIALALYWFAHAYANLLGRRLATRKRLTGRGLWLAIVHDWAIVRGAAIPLLALPVAWALGATQTAAVTAALWSAVVSLVAFELLAGVRARATPGELVLEGTAGAAMGLAIVALKVVLH